MSQPEKDNNEPSPASEPSAGRESSDPVLSDVDRREALLRGAIEDMEADIAARKAKNKVKSERWTRLEGIYMVIFQVIVILLMGGLHGAQLLDSSGHLSRAAMIDRDGQVHFSLGRMFGGFGDFVDGFPLHFADHWYADLGLLGITILIAFKVKDVRRRRRYFSLMTALTVVVIGYYLTATLPGLGDMH